MYTWIFRRVMDDVKGVPIHHPLVFKQHLLEDTGTVHMCIYIYVFVYVYIYTHV